MLDYGKIFDYDNQIKGVMQLKGICQKCGYVWVIRIEAQPKQCPFCKVRNWSTYLKDQKRKEMKCSKKQ